ncbi:MAG TPA: hypothetical protein VLB44_12650, partial [Kofleriaceae bacterium]|nr:hypothetical protein [Kofleriaceae bacterium]
KKYVVFVRQGQNGAKPANAGERGEADKYVSREVTVGRSVDGTVQVLSGLSVGDQVVVKGALLLDTAAEQLL